MCRVGVATVVAWSCQIWSSSAQSSTEKGACEFENEPVGVGYFWDPTCELGGLGCFADANNTECRFCGAGDFLTIDCPPSSCHFPHQPVVPYYWDKDCVAGALGCWADGVHAQCRYCGDYPFTSLPCPVGAAPPSVAGCAFNTTSDTPSYWEPGCDSGTFGCLADGKNVNCRFCGVGNYTDIPCPAAEVCTFANEPSFPYFWDSTCQGGGGLGCNADGIHQECRFCAVRPFEDVPCPGQVAPPENTCTWPLHGEPLTPSFWDSTCALGDLGCWADGLHAECRFCGEGVFANISCVSAGTGSGSEILANASEEAENESNISANASAEAQNGIQILTKASGDAQNSSLILANASGDAQNASQMVANFTERVQNASQLSVNASGGAQNGSQILANASGDAQNSTLILANASGDAQNASQVLANSTGEVQNASQLSVNASGEAQNGTQLLANVSDEVGNGTALAIANSSMNETTVVQVEENQTVNSSMSSQSAWTQDENQTNQTYQTDGNHIDQNQTTQTSVGLGASFARAFDFQVKNTSVEEEEGEWWDELNAAVPNSLVLAVLTMMLPLLL